MAKKNVFSDDATTIDAQAIQETIEQRARQIAETGDSDITLSDEDTDPDELRALAEMDGGSDINFQVIRVLPAATKGYIGSLSSAELSLSKIQEEYGPGRYRVRGIRSNGTYAGQRTVDIAAPQVKINAVSVAGQPQNSMQDFIAMMQAQQERSSQSMKEWAAILAPIAVAVLPNLFGSKSNAPTLAELTQTMLNMRSLSAPESQVSKMKELKEMLELTNSLKPEDNTGSTWVDLIRDGVKELAPMVPAIMGAAQRGAQSAPTIQAQATDAPQAPQVTQGEPDMLAWLKAQLTGLVHQASRNKDPGLYAEIVLDNLPEGADPKQLRMLLAQSNWWATLSGFHPPVVPYKAWFDDCRKELLAGLDEMLGLTQEAPKKTKSAPAPMPTDHSDSHDGE